MSASVNVHGTAIWIADRGLLIRGPSGSGKSSLALSLLRRAEAAGLPADLVADDQIFVSSDGPDIHACVPGTLAGLIEVRGVGILRAPYRRQARIDLVVDLVPRDRIERLPEPYVFTQLAGHPVRRIELAERDPGFGADLLITLVGSTSFWEEHKPS